MEINAFDDRVAITGCASRKEFIRIPREVIAKITRLEELSCNTSGIRIRFVSDTKSILIKAKNGNLSKYVHMSVSAASGFDIYLNNVMKANIHPVYMSLETNETVRLQDGDKENIIDIYFPLYNSVTEFSFCIDEGASLKKYESAKKPVLFYGSSITQGACASRPGNSYVNMLSSMLETPVINLGYSGDAKGDIPIAEYIASLDIGAFVYDYDHNAPDTKWLEETHELFFRVIRAKKQDLPILMLSRPGYEKWEDVSKLNTAVVMTTYLDALGNGDKNVYFIDGKVMFGSHDRDKSTIDGTHPNDLGFYRMAKTIFPVLRKILED